MLAPLQLAITDAEAARVVGAALPPVLSIGAWIAFAPPSSAPAERQTWRLPLLLVLLTAAIYVFGRSYAGVILLMLLGAGWALLGGSMFSRILEGRRARQLREPVGFLDSREVVYDVSMPTPPFPEQSSWGTRPRAFYTLLWETGLRAGTLSRLSVPEDYDPRDPRCDRQGALRA